MFFRTACAMAAARIFFFVQCQITEMKEGANRFHIFLQSISILITRDIVHQFVLHTS